MCKKVEKGEQGGVSPTHRPVDAARPPLIVIGGW